MLRLTKLFAAIFVSAPLLLPQSATAENTITWATQLSYRDMNPAVSFGAETYILGNIYETLFLYDDGEVKPRLAVSWSKSDGGRVWNVTLRDGVKFHDGSQLDSAVVKKSFEYTRDLGKGAGYLYADLETVETPDSRTAVFKFKKPIAFDLVASGQYGSYVIGPAAIDKGHDWMNEGNAIGTGPYTLTKYEPNKLTVISKFDDYWGGWKPGQIDRVIHPVVSEASTRVQMIKSGEADVVRVPVSQLAALDALPNTSVATSSGWRNQMYLLNMQKYPTDSKKFREALVHLWNYDSVLNDIFQGYAKRPLGPVPASMWGHGKYDIGSFDPQKALKLLEESGIPKEDWKIDAMYSNSNQEQIDAVELFQANAAQVGVRVNLLPQVSKAYMTKARSASTAANMHSMVWYPAYPTPSDWLYSLFKTRKENTGFNLSRYKNAEFDAALATAIDAEGVDVKESAKAYIAAQDILMKDTPAIFFADVDRVFTHSSSLKGMDKSSNPAYETLFIYALSK
ncbi:ABC transporter substrate-binding protein [Pelagibius litoralis]|uniref:ABC transporter substrate-binding protein n=1 Tax=Pelagibius litoralis TaxID=374515 RepID=A0A967K8G6_9PROT|nr:ABC transporter substrate-binding protein [Pelagibius litoralis]NIA70438.1 ABC transporter substrate-binding protein [Pelagibius litoralis]